MKFRSRRGWTATDLVNLSVIFVVGIIGSTFGTLVGGTSLITIPVLIFLGLPPRTPPSAMTGLE